MVARKRKPVAKRAPKVAIAKGVKVKRGAKAKMQQKAGGSNVGKYKGVSKGKFCGPSGGAPSGSYPVDTAKRCRSALAYARNAPHPGGIKACVKRKCKGMIKKYSKK